MREALPEVHAKYALQNGLDGRYYTRDKYRSYVRYTTSSVNHQVNGALILLMEESTRGGFHTIRMSYENRLWTIRVSETTSIPYDPDVPGTEVVSVPV